MNFTNEKELVSSTYPILIEEELKNSFLDYAMSVVVSRAIPDVRDGLKPVHRRILYTMNQLGFYHNKPYHKSVRIVGEVLGKYHPHGDQAVYNTIVGMVQNFSKRYPLLDGQGNWGSVDGDNAAAMRYTEIRMAKISQEILWDIDKNTVDFVPNFDESTVEPTLLPSRLPNFIINGTSGIAVGMATSVPPHNLSEIVSACLALIKNKDLSDEELFKLVPGPDFPTGGIICGKAGIFKAYSTGRGNLILRGVVDIEETKRGTSLIIKELPYQVNKSDLIIKIADLVKNKVIEGISNIRDESDKNGVRVDIELKKGETPQVILNLLYKHTPLQSSVGILMLALLDNKPMIFTLRQVLEEFLNHRQYVITKRLEFDLNKALAKEHILIGFSIVINNIDEVIALIKSSDDAQEASSRLSTKFQFTQEQIKAILEMRLQRLTGLEQDKINDDLKEVQKEIASIKVLLSNKELLKKEIEEELIYIKDSYGDVRKTKIEGPVGDVTEADFITNDEVVVTLTKKGYIKRVTLDNYSVQHRGGKGKMATASLENNDDVLQDIVVANNHDELLFFTNLGRIYNLFVYQTPEGSRISKGRAVVNILPLNPEEYIVKLLCTKDLDDKNLVMLTRNGIIKRTHAQEFRNIRSTGIRAITLNDNDQLVFCALSSGNDTIVIATAKGQGIRFKEEEVRAMGRQAAGVIGIRLHEGDYVVGLEVLDDESKDILFATENGYGKRVKIDDFRVAHRGGYGVRTIPTDKRNGQVMGLVLVDDCMDILLIDQQGKIIRLYGSGVRTLGRQAKGVRLIKLDNNVKLVCAFAVLTANTDVDEEKCDPNNTGNADINDSMNRINQDLHKDLYNDIDNVIKDTDDDSHDLEDV